MNLIEQQNILRGMPDDALKQAIMTQSSVPPYLVLTEIQRRKNARDRYMQMSQKQDAANTVAEELMGGRMPEMVAPAAAPGIEAAMGMAMPPAVPAGLEAAMPPQNFADGGQVGYAPGGSVTLQDILAKLSNYGVDQEQAKEDAITAAMLQASAAMLNSGSSNTFKNIGAGLGAAAPAYQTAMKDARANDMALLQAQAGVLGDISTAGRQAEELELQRQRLQNDLAYQTRALDIQMMTDETKRASWADKQTGWTEDQRNQFILQPRIDAATDDFQKALNAELRVVESTVGSAEEKAAMLQRARVNAMETIAATYGEDVLKYLPIFANAGNSDGAPDTYVDAATGEVVRR